MMVKVDVAALQFVVVFTGNLLVGFMDRSVDTAMRLAGAGGASRWAGSLDNSIYYFKIS